jgi:hypothetical protein
MLTSLFAGGAIIGTLVGFWSTIKMYLMKIYSLFVVTIHFKNPLAIESALYYLFEHMKVSKIKTHSVVGLCLYKRSINAYRSFLFDMPPTGSQIYWRGWKPVLVNVDDKAFSISFIRGFFNYTKLLKDIEDYYNKVSYTKEKMNRFHIQQCFGSLKRKDSESEYPSPLSYNGNSAEATVPVETSTNNGMEKTILNIILGGAGSNISPLFHDKSDVGQRIIKNPIDMMALNSDSMAMVEDIKHWYNSESWYKDRFIPWKRGFLLHGNPGNGKSSLTRLLGMEFNMPIFAFDLSTFTNGQFINEWKCRTSNWSPCIMLLEDIDSVFNGRKNVTGYENALTFDCLLNCIDGVGSNDGVITIITTNKIDTIDEAIGKPNGDGLTTRPGRIDRLVEMTPPNEEGRRKIAKRILRDYPDQIESVVHVSHNDSGAQFQERCTRLALELYWKDKKD